MERTEVVGRRLRLRDLKLLDAVARWGSIAKAAKQLNITQPAASRAIAQLEHTLGVRLLDRSARGVEPTLYGQALLRRSVVIFDEVRQGIKEIEFLTNPTAGELRIGCSEVLVAGFLPTVIERLRHQYPRIVCHVDQAATAAMPDFSELRERRVDLAIGHIPDTVMDDDMDVDILFRERTFVVAGQQSKWARRRKIALAELVDEPWLLVPPNTSSYAMIEEAFVAHGLNMPKPSIVSYSVHLRNSLLPTGRYLAYLPASFMQFGAMRSSFKVLPVDFPVKPRSVAVITVKNRTLSPVAQLFIDCAHEVAKPLAKLKP